MRAPRAPSAVRWARNFLLRVYDVRHTRAPGREALGLPRHGPGSTARCIEAVRCIEAGKHARGAGSLGPRGHRRPNEGVVHSVAGTFLDPSAFGLLLVRPRARRPDAASADPAGVVLRGRVVSRVQLHSLRYRRMRCERVGLGRSSATTTCLRMRLCVQSQGPCARSCARVFCYWFTVVCATAGARDRSHTSTMSSCPKAPGEATHVVLMRRWLRNGDAVAFIDRYAVRLSFQQPPQRANGSCAGPVPQSSR